jgi:hypothetical protein
MKRFDVVWRRGNIRFSDLNVVADTAEAAVEIVRARHFTMFEALVSVERVDSLFFKTMPVGNPCE